MLLVFCVLCLTLASKLNVSQCLLEFPVFLTLTVFNRVTLFSPLTSLIDVVCDLAVVITFLYCPTSHSFSYISDFFVLARQNPDRSIYGRRSALICPDVLRFEI